MNISVGCRSRAGASEPSRLCLGQCRLPVTHVKELPPQSDVHVYEVRVLDGRRFVVRRQTAEDRWELVAVYDRSTRRQRRSRIGAAIAALVLVLLALAQKGLRFARQAVTWRRHAHRDVPSGGAPA